VYLANVVVQPDVVVVLNASLGKITATRIIGAPELVVEVASLGTSGYDRREKQDAYARAGVLEYWIANTEARTVEVLVLDAGIYHSLMLFKERQRYLRKFCQDLQPALSSSLYRDCS